MKEWIKDIVIALVIALIVVQFIKPTIVKESSMEPNFYANDYLFVSKQAYSFNHEVERGDVIVFKSDLDREEPGKEGEKKLLIKRVIGLPGDTVTVKDGEVYLNGMQLEESYIKEGTTSGEVDEFVVPEGEYFVMGDNRRVSIDSRDLRVGAVDGDRIVGKVVLRVYPFNKFGLIK